MKKIFMLLAIVCAFASCDPVSENFSNAGHITIDELKEMSIVSVDNAGGGLTGNVITCSTSAPVNAKWSFDGKDLIGNFAMKKMPLGMHNVVLTALCADGTEVSINYPVECQAITNPLKKYYLYGGPDSDQGPLTLSGDAAFGRFSDNEGKGLPYLSDEVYFGLKTLVFEVVEAADGPFIWGGEGAPAEAPTMRIMNGWWSATYADDVPVRDQIKDGKWELTLTEEIAKDCAKGGGGQDLTLLMTRGTVTISAVYYEE